MKGIFKYISIILMIIAIGILLKMINSGYHLPVKEYITIILLSLSLVFRELHEIHNKI
jgi:hypothetical protein